MANLERMWSSLGCRAVLFWASIKQVYEAVQKGSAILGKCNEYMKLSSGSAILG